MDSLFNLIPGKKITNKGKTYTITHITDADTVICRQDSSGLSARFCIKDVKIDPTSQNSINIADQEIELLSIADEDWQEANKRFQIILPLLKKDRNFQMVKEVAKSAGVGKSTIYRWLKTYEASEKLSSLVPTNKNAGGKGKTRLYPEVEKILQNTIQDYYLRSQKPSIQKTYEEVMRHCRNAGIDCPHPNTIRNRISLISEVVKLQRRSNKKKATEKYTPLVGYFPGADYPLSIVQIDHTKLDIILVDDVVRKPIGRPWLTLAIDVFSRMVTGLYISFDPPSAMSVGLCITSSILPKETWLTKIGISTPWPCWGLMKTLHMDNAPEFRSNMLKRACEEYRINIEWRPVSKPNYGGHIERLLGTFAKEIHTLPGTTFSNPTQRGEYDSEAKAVMTLTEFEKWLITYITGVYHQRVHTTLGVSPIKKHEEGIFGTAERPGCGLVNAITDVEKLKLDFMPYVERTIQEYGVVIDDIYYYGEVLRRYIHKADPRNPKLKQKFLFKRDPRDISVVYFYDVEVKQYFTIPYRDTSRPAISIWELHQATKKLEDMGYEQVNEALIFEAYEQMRREQEKAVKETKQARLKRQRRTFHQKIDKPLSINSADNKQKAINKASNFLVEEITPFDELEEL